MCSSDLAVIGHRAQTGARMVYDFISDKVVHDKGETGSIDAKQMAGQNTLTADDLGPAWRGPEPRKHAQPRKSGKNPA